MATDQLPTAGTSQSQSVTQDPQSGVQSINTGTQSSGLQPGTANNLLNGQSGVTLSNPALPSVNLGGNGATSTTASQPAPAVQKHHVSPALLGFPVVLVLLAAVSAWSINRSAKAAS